MLLLWFLKYALFDFCASFFSVPAFVLYFCTSNSKGPWHPWNWIDSWWPLVFLVQFSLVFRFCELRSLCDTCQVSMLQPPKVSPLIAGLCWPAQPGEILQKAQGFERLADVQSGNCALCPSNCLHSARLCPFTFAVLWPTLLMTTFTESSLWRGTFLIGTLLEHSFY